MESEIANIRLLLAALESLDIEKNKKEYQVKCEVSKHGIKLLGHTKAFDVSSVCFLGPAILKEYQYKWLEKNGKCVREPHDLGDWVSQSARGVSQTHELLQNGIPLKQSMSTINAFDNPDGAYDHGNIPQLLNTERYEFALSHSIFRDALKNQSGSTIKLKYDPMRQVFSIVGMSRKDS